MRGLWFLWCWLKMSRLTHIWHAQQLTGLLFSTWSLINGRCLFSGRLQHRGGTAITSWQRYVIGCASLWYPSRRGHEVLTSEREMPNRLYKADTGLTYHQSETGFYEGHQILRDLGELMVGKAGGSDVGSVRQG